MTIGKTGAPQNTFQNVEAKLKHLEGHHNPNNPVGSRPNAILLGQELAKVALGDLPSFKNADRRLSEIASILIDGGMGSVVSAVENAFHGGVSDGATGADVLRANKQSQQERAR